MKLEERLRPHNRRVQLARELGLYPYFRPVEGGGVEVQIDGRPQLMFASNDYLGLSQDRRVKAAAAKALQHWGSATGGSRLLCGTLSLHQALEERLAAFLGKRQALVHSTGFGANLGVIPALAADGDALLCDKACHASMLDGARSSPARLLPFAHNRPAAAARILERLQRRQHAGCTFLLTEGVFSMSGEIAPLPDLLDLRRLDPDLVVYLDDAHGLGVLGAGGRGSAEHWGVTSQVDFLMGTFSKSLASIGGFVASDHGEALDYLRHQSRPLIFSAALPAPNLAAALAALEILQQEPELSARLRERVRRLRTWLAQAGLPVAPGDSPVIPLLPASDEAAFRLAQALFEEGLFVVPVAYPAVRRDQPLLRIACTLLHRNEHLERLVDALARLVPLYPLKTIGP